MHAAPARLVLGNWKMHLDAAGAAELARAVSRYADAQNAVQVGICPPAIYIPIVKQVLTDDSTLWLGGQDCGAKPFGAYTGDISAMMLKDVGCHFVLIGHSECRANHGDKDSDIQNKILTAIYAGLHVVLCIGEHAADRKAGNWAAVLEAQLRAALPHDVRREQLSIAYEPIWAIGTGVAATEKDIAQAHELIKQQLVQILGQQPDSLPRVLYGGSVKPNNALEILSLSVVDGVLVGGASLEASSFASIIQSATQVTTASRV